MKTINEIAKTQVFFITGGAIGFFVLNFEIENIIASHIILKHWHSSCSSGLQPISIIIISASSLYFIVYFL